MSRTKPSTFRARGYFIGSGAIESANKVIIQRHLKQSGMLRGVIIHAYPAHHNTKVESERWLKEVNEPFMALAKAA